jgi:hypothetical protein
MFVGCGEEDVSDVVSLLESTSKRLGRNGFVWASLGERTNTIDGKKRYILKLLSGGIEKNTFASELS